MFSLQKIHIIFSKFDLPLLRPVSFLDIPICFTDELIAMICGNTASPQKTREAAG